MKLTYKHAEVQIIFLSNDDVIRTSTPIRLDQGEYGRSDALEMIY